jgi:hypothetical protein
MRVDEDEGADDALDDALDAEAIDSGLFDELDAALGNVGYLRPQKASSHVSLPLFRPQTREECAEVPRPCPFVSCRHNLYLDVRSDGVLRINFPDREPDEMVASCALDLASDGPRTLDTIAGLMGMSKERARQLEHSAFRSVRQQLTAEDVD